MTFTQRGRTWATFALVVLYVGAFLVGLLTDWSMA